MEARPKLAISSPLDLYFGETTIPYKYTTFESGPPVATVILNHPEGGNRVDIGMVEELQQICRLVRECPGIRLLIVKGAGKHFSVGRAPFPEELNSAPIGARQCWIEQHRVADAVANLPIPVIVVINGDAIDHGLELALAGDLRIAASHARFGLTDLSRGSFPWDGGTQRLPRLVGPAWAKDMLLTSRVIDATEALALGLVNRVVEAGELSAAADEMAHSIIAGGPIAAQYAKETVNLGMDLSLDQGLRLEADLNVILQSTADRKEGLQSFTQRRDPKFGGS